MKLVFQIAAGVAVGLAAWTYRHALARVVLAVVAIFLLYWAGVWLALVVRSWASSGLSEAERARIRQKVEEIARE